MKEICELIFPGDIKYTTTHEWVRQEGDLIRVGITDYAQDNLSDIVFVELPGEGEVFKKGDEFGGVESVKAFVSLYMPVGGEILTVNPALEDSPGLVNEDPYGAGWMLEIKPGGKGELDELLTSEAYLKTLEGDRETG